MQINPMSIKANYIKLSNKFGGPYALMKKGIKRSVIGSIMKDKDVRISNAIQVAHALGVSVEELCSGKARLAIQETINEAPEQYQTDEERRYMDKLLAVLRGQDEAKKATVKGVLDLAKQDIWTNKKTAQ